MSREYTRAVLHLSCDERLVSCVGGALAYFAERGGLGERSRDSLVAALEEFCLDALPSVGGTEEPLDVAIEDFEDRIEIVVQQRTHQESAAGKWPARGGGAKIPQDRMALRRLAQAVDKIECDARNGNIRTTLVKFL